MYVYLRTLLYMYAHVHKCVSPCAICNITTQMSSDPPSPVPAISSEKVFFCRVANGFWITFALSALHTRVFVNVCLVSWCTCVACINVHLWFHGAGAHGTGVTARVCNQG